MVLRARKHVLRIVACLCAALLLTGLLAAPVHAAGSTDTVTLTERIYQMNSDASVDIEQDFRIALNGKQTSCNILVGSLHSLPDDIEIRLNGHLLKNRDLPGYDRSIDVFNYRASANSRGLFVTCHFPEISGDVRINVTFHLKNIVTLYSDAAIIDAELIDDDSVNYGESITQIKLPKKTDPEQIDIFWDDYHLDPVSQTDGEIITLSMTDVEAGTYLKTKVAVPADVFPDTPNNYRRQSRVLPDLIKTRDRELTYINYHSWFVTHEKRVVLISLVLAFILGIFTRIRRMRHRPLSIADSANALPKDLSPMQMSQIIGFYKRLGRRKRSRNALYGTLISLVDRGILSVYPTRKSGDFELVYTPWDGCETTGEENILLLLLFEDIAKGGSSVTFSEISRYSRLLPGVVSSAVRHMNDYATSELSQAHHIEYFKFVKLPLDIVFQLVFLVAAVVLAFLQCWKAALGVFIGIFIISFFGRDRLHRLSQTGEDALARIRAFRRYVIEAMRKKSKVELPSLSWWSSVLGYCAAIGLGPHLERTLPQKYPELLDPAFADSREGSAPLWGLAAAPSLGSLSHALWHLTTVLMNTQKVIERSETEK